MERQGEFLHPLLHQLRAGDREIRRRDARALPLVRTREDHHAAKPIEAGPRSPV